MRRLDFPARLPVGEGALGEGARLRFEPLPISGDARGHLSGVGAALRVGLWPHSPRRGASWRMERNLEPTRAPQPQGPALARPLLLYFGSRSRMWLIWTHPTQPPLTLQRLEHHVDVFQAVRIDVVRLSSNHTRAKPKRPTRRRR
jgi:hypothetical protein